MYDGRHGRGKARRSSAVFPMCIEDLCTRRKLRCKCRLSSQVSEGGTGVVENVEGAIDRTDWARDDVGIVGALRPAR